MQLHTAEAGDVRARPRRRPRETDPDLPPCPPPFVRADQRLLRFTGALADLTEQMRDTLAAMLRLAVQWNAPGEWFVLSVKRLMRALGRCRNSVVNYMRQLREDGWIERDRCLDGARRLGMPVGSTRLTDKTLEALALARHAHCAGHASRAFQAKPASQGNAPEAPPVDNLPESKPEAPVLQPCVIAQDGSRIPHDLAPLLVAMTGRQLCSVLGVAGPLGVRVQDIAKQALPAIVKATWPVAYLKRLVRSDQDWKVPRRQEKVAPVSVKSRSTLAAERLQRQAEQRERELPPPTKPPAALLARRNVHAMMATTLTNLP
ncbi:hypothetical protein [Azohydromonas aeria]|uniref:hypothetical protein n=1 Tax=Azohydromonas aeria TaxID=2590212 RepID=UPI0012FA3104|nr:hypothetical protein [Azohydromonas aeria]